MKEKILLLDDNRDLLLILQIILRGQGYETILAASVEEALYKIKIHKPSLILMDVFICEQDGYEFCRNLKLNAETNHTRVIMMSGYDASYELISYSAADDFIQKPFNYDDLIARIESQMLPISA